MFDESLVLSDFMRQEMIDAGDRRVYMECHIWPPDFTPYYGLGGDDEDDQEGEDGEEEEEYGLDEEGEEEEGILGHEDEDGAELVDLTQLPDDHSSDLSDIEEEDVEEAED